MHRSVTIEDYFKDTGYGRFAVVTDDNGARSTVNNLDTPAQALLVAAQFLEEEE